MSQPDTTAAVAPPFAALPATGRALVGAVLALALAAVALVTVPSARATGEARLAAH